MSKFQYLKYNLVCCLGNNQRDGVLILALSLTSWMITGKTTTCFFFFSTVFSIVFNGADSTFA